MNRTGGALLAAALTAGTLVPALASTGAAQAGTVSGARAVTPALTLSPKYPLAGSTARLRATVPTKGQRTVQLQKLSGASWTKVKSKLSTTTGVAVFSLTTPKAVTTYRAFAPKVAAKSLKAVTTPKVVLHPQFPPIPGTTQELGIGEYPFVSGNGSHVAYDGFDEEGFVAVRRHTVSDGGDIVIGRGHGATLSGNGSTVLYEKGGTGPWDPSWGLARWVSGAQSTIWQESADGDWPWVRFYPGGVSADGSLASFVASDSADPEERLGVYRVDGTSYQRVAWADSVTSDIAPDGSCIAFDTAEKLVPRDDNGKLDAYLWLSASKTFVLLARDTDGTSPPYLSTNASMSNGCRYVAWDQGAKYSSWEVRLWDRSTGKRTLVSHALDGKSYGDNTKASVSADGAYVAFESTASLTSDKDDGLYDVYLWRRSNDAITLLTPTKGPIGAGLHPEISDDGRHVAFDGGPKDCESPCDRRIYLWSRSN